MAKALPHGLAMSRRTALSLVAASALPHVFGGGNRLAAAEPVPETWMYAGNAARTGVYPGTGLDLTQDIVELWRIEGNQTGIIAWPSGLGDGIVYYRPVPDGVSPEVVPLIAMDARTGAELWRRDPPLTEPPTAFQDTAAIADGLLAMVTSSGLLVGIDAKTGEERWIFDLQGKPSATRPAIVDGVLYVTDSAAVNAVKLGKTPDWLWKTPLADGTTTVVSRTVSVDGDAVVVSTVGPSADPDAGPDGKTSDIHVLNAADGNETYRFQLRSQGETSEFALQDGMLYSRIDKSFLGRSHFYSMTLDGAERWMSRTSDTLVYPVVAGDLVYISGGDRVWAYDAATGETAWSTPPLQSLRPNLALIEDVIYVASASDQVLHALSATDGSMLATIPMPSFVSHVVGMTDGVLIVSGWLNILAVANPR